MDTEVMFSQAADVWGTPQWLFDALDKEFGFTLDPCSDGTNAKCAKFYSINDSGLLKDWGTETVFMNPPYSQCQDWMRKAYGAAQEGATVVCLVPSRTDTDWWHRCCCSVLFATRRITPEAHMQAIDLKRPPAPGTTWKKPRQAEAQRGEGPETLNENRPETTARKWIRSIGRPWPGLHQRTMPRCAGVVGPGGGGAPGQQRGGRGAVVDRGPQLAQAVSTQALHSSSRARIDDAHALDDSGLHLFGMGLALQVGGGNGVAALDFAQGVTRLTLHLGHAVVVCAPALHLPASPAAERHARQQGGGQAGETAASEERESRKDHIVPLMQTPACLCGR